MRNGLLNIPLFIPTDPSTSVSIIADVPITIQAVKSSLVCLGFTLNSSMRSGYFHFGNNPILVPFS